jgi:hypothetical protein
MSLPLRKENEALTTADLAHPNRPVEVPENQIEEDRPKLVRSDYSDAEQTPRRDVPVATEATPLFPDDQLRDLKARWDTIQTSFVDEPRTAVQQADSLVATTMQHLAEAFSKERTNLEQQWDRGDNISTEDLRMAFQRYRSFFRRLLSL